MTLNTDGSIDQKDFYKCTNTPVDVTTTFNLRVTSCRAFSYNYKASVFTIFTAKPDLSRLSFYHRVSAASNRFGVDRLWRQLASLYSVRLVSTRYCTFGLINCQFIYILILTHLQNWHMHGSRYQCLNLKSIYICIFNTWAWDITVSI